jgi:outer membrane receptor for ferrienterochelin and colicins
MRAVMRRLEQRRLPQLCAATLLAPSLALAEVPPEPVDVVVTGTRTPESAERATVRTEVITRDEAEDRGARSVSDALLDEAALDVQPSSNGVAGAVSMRGLDGEHVLVLEDGVPVAGRSAGAVDLGELPIQNASRIEYVLGPMSALYGSDALGGVINIITSAPEHEGPSATTRLETRSRNELYGAASASYQRRDDWVTVETSLLNRPGVERGEGPDLLVPKTRTGMFGVRAGTTLLGRIDLRVKTRFTRDLRAGVFSTTETIGGEPTVARSDSNLRNDRTLVSVAETLHLSAKARLDFHLSRQWYDADSTVSLRNSSNRDLTEGRERVQRLEAVATLGEAQRTWVFGAGTENQKLTETAEGVVFRNQRLVTTREDTLKPAFRSNAWGFAQLGWELTPEVTATLATRGEIHDPYGDVLAPRAALAVRPTPTLTLRASGGRGYRTPSAKEIGFEFDHCSLGYSVNGNPDLEPEDSWGITGDASFRPSERVSFKAGAHSNWLTQMIALEPTDAPGLCSSGDNYRMVNIGKARTAGADASLRVRPTSWSTATASYAYLWTRDEARDQPLSASPPHSVSASLRVDLSRRFAALVRFRYTSGAFIENGDADLHSVAYATLAARIAYRPVAPLSVYVGGENLTNVQRDTDRLGDQRPLLGRTLYLGISGDFNADAPDND